MYLQKLEIEINIIFGFFFKMLVGIKLFDYFRRFVEKFNIYQMKVKQWKVLLVENSLFVLFKKCKKLKYVRVFLNKVLKVEDFDIFFIYLGIEINIEDLFISFLNKYEECIVLIEEFENFERCFDII